MLSALGPCDVESAVRREHDLFVATRLGVTFAALAVVPFFLAYHGAPDLIDTLVLAIAFAPLAGACVVLRTGRLDRGHALSAIGAAALALTLWFKLGSSLGCAVTWLAVAQVEVMQIRRWRAPAACAAAVILLAMLILPSSSEPRSELVEAIFSALALAYAAMVVLARQAPSVPAIAGERRIEQIQAAEAPRDGATTWADAADLAGGAILELDPRGSVRTVHGTTHGLRSDRALARGFFEHVHVADRPGFLQLIADVAHGAAGAPMRLRVRRFDDAPSQAPTYQTFELSVLPRGIRRSVHALVRAAEAADEAATLLPPNARHELRTPLNAIIGFSEMLGSRTLRPADAEKQIEYARIIHRSGQTLLDLIDNKLAEPVRLPAAAATTPAADSESTPARMKKRA